MIGAEEFAERVVRLGADRGPRGFPRAKRDREILMKSITLELDEQRVYSEREINAQLERWKREIGPALDVDHVTLRRWLVDYGHLERTRDGSAYRVGFPARALAFDLAIYELDLRATVAAFLAEQARRAEERKVKHHGVEVVRDSRPAAGARRRRTAPR